MTPLELAVLQAKNNLRARDRIPSRHRTPEAAAAARELRRTLARPASVTTSRLLVQAVTFNRLATLERDAYRESLTRRSARAWATQQTARDAEQVKADDAAVRAWARAQGHTVPTRGRIPRTVLAAYQEAHP